MLNKKRESRGGFDLIAPVYDPLSRLVFGNTQRKAQAHWLGEVPKKADILVFGGGSGWLLARILSDCNPRQVIYIDASPVMIAMAQKKVNNDHRVDFRTGTETAIQPADKVDVLFTPFVLDLFTKDQLENCILPVLHQSLRANGLWFCCDFLKPTRWWQRALMWMQYRFFRFISRISASQLPAWETLLNSLPTLQPGPMATFFGGLIGSGYWQKIAPDSDSKA